MNKPGPSLDVWNLIITPYLQVRYMNKFHEPDYSLNPIFGKLECEFKVSLSPYLSSCKQLRSWTARNVGTITLLEGI